MTNQRPIHLIFLITLFTALPIFAEGANLASLTCAGLIHDPIDPEPKKIYLKRDAATPAPARTSQQGFTDHLQIIPANFFKPQPGDEPRLTPPKGYLAADLEQKNPRLWDVSITRSDFWLRYVDMDMPMGAVGRMSAEPINPQRTESVNQNSKNLRVIEELKNKYYYDEIPSLLPLTRKLYYQQYGSQPTLSQFMPTMRKQDNESWGQLLVFGFGANDAAFPLLKDVARREDISTRLLDPYLSGLHRPIPALPLVFELYGAAEVTYSTDPNRLLHEESPDFRFQRKSGELWVSLGRTFFRALGDIDQVTRPAPWAENEYKYLSLATLALQLTHIDYAFNPVALTAQMGAPRLRQIRQLTGAKLPAVRTVEVGTDARGKPNIHSVVVIPRAELHRMAKGLYVYLMYKFVERTLHENTSEFVISVGSAEYTYAKELGILDWLLQKTYGPDYRSHIILSPHYEWHQNFRPSTERNPYNPQYPGMSVASLLDDPNATALFSAHLSPATYEQFFEYLKSLIPERARAASDSDN